MFSRILRDSWNSLNSQARDADFMPYFTALGHSSARAKCRAKGS